MDGKSMDIAGDKLNQLKAILPEAFTENKIDWEKLRAALGDNIEFKNEMEEVVKLKVPLKVEIASGRNWDEAH